MKKERDAELSNTNKRDSCFLSDFFSLVKAEDAVEKCAVRACNNTTLNSINNENCSVLLFLLHGGPCMNAWVFLII